MLALGIESSCDETGIALVRLQDGRASILHEVLASQHATHQPYGGVVPELAAREHVRALPLLLNQVWEQSGCDPEQLDVVAVTQGPGLVGCLLMGLSFASGLAAGWGVPVIGVNHIEGHILAPMLDHPELTFPYLALVVSGGHTELHVVRGLGQYELLERTLDDAAGEAFDKAAHLLGFPYPGGPQLAKAADAFAGKSRFELPRVMLKRPGFSFSGLKTAIALLVQRECGQQKPAEALQQELAAVVQASINRALVYKVQQALRRTGLERVVVTGGVSANRALRLAISQVTVDGRRAVQAFFPRAEHSVDNAAMIAYVGALRGAGAGVLGEPRSRWPVESMEPPRGVA